MLGAWFGARSWRDERRDQAFRERTTVVEATIDPSWDGGRLVPVTYPDLADGRPRRAVVRWGTYPPARDAGSVEIRVGAGADPEVGPQPYGDHERWPLLMQFAFPAIGGSALWLLARRHRLRRSRALIASVEPAYRMLAVPLPGRVFGRRWRLALHEVDARPGDPAVCVVPVVGQPLRDGVRPVEVKGRPRPGGEVVVREEAGRVWWPAGRAMVGARSALDAPSAGGPSSGDVASRAESSSRRPLLVDRGRVPVGAWVLLAIAMAAFVVSMETGDDPDAAAERSVPTTGTVVVGRSSPGPVTVELEWKGDRRTAQVVADTPVEAGTSLSLRVDPEVPGRVWAQGQEVPEVDDPGWSVFLFVVSVPVLLVAAMAVRRPSDPLRARLDDSVGDGPAAHGFDLIDGTLWFRGDAPTRRRPRRSLWRLDEGPAPPVLGFEPRGLVVVTADELDVWSWDRHVGRDAGPFRWYAATDGHRLTLRAPHDLVVIDTTSGASVVDLIETVARTPGMQERLADSEWLEGVVVALAAVGPRRGPAGPTILGDG